ncbi:MAG TPA: signal recognition particle-docking protein FtsY [Ignavibacteriaceae bacterium]|nr:signal recognition particle-docking protein FtsY [Ignavibacteriaceae bacterium]
MKLFKNINFDKLKNGLSKTRSKIVNSITETITGKVVIDESIINELEEVLISSDIGYKTTEKLIENVQVKLKEVQDRSGDSITRIIKDELINILNVNNKSKVYDSSEIKPYVILIVGVNGVGKTTTIGKLAYNYRMAGNKVIIGAADTFRAAANEQLEIWAQRAGVEIIKKNQGSDPSSVAFDAVNNAINSNAEIVIIDTAGRLQSKSNLMNELNKIKRAIDKVLPGAPHETLLVLDGTVGQNALSQLDEFSKVTNVTGLVITKLDGTAKGGAVIQLCTNYQIPVKYIGIGEGLEDLMNFDSNSFIEAMFN